MVLLLCGLITTPSFAKEQISLPPQPLTFEHNQGQAGGHAEYFARGKGYLLYLRATEAVLALKGTGTTKPLRLRLLGATPHAKTAGQTPLPGRHNYYIGNNPARWYTNIPTYARVATTGVYPGIDMVYYGKDGMLEYDFKVAAGADPRAIRLGFDGVDKLRVNHNGELLITLGKAQLVQHPPYAYQNIDGKRIPVTARYALRGRTVSFALGDYDHQQPLVIDPALSYSSYLGGSNDDEAKAVAVDGDGNIYVTGWTMSTDFPEAATTTGTTLNPTSSIENNSDAFVTMLNKHGTIVFSAYLGSNGTIDSGYNTPEGGYGIAVSSGKIYVTGVTASQASTVFPSLGTPSPYQACNPNTNSVFVSILNNDGSLYYSTCVGTGLSQVGTGIAVDGTGDAYVTGWTTSSGFPVTSATAVQTTKTTNVNLRSSFFFKLDPTAGTSGLLYSTYLGSTLDGNATCCDTYTTAVAVDSANMAYVAGWTGVSATDFPTAFQTALSSGAYPVNNGGNDAFFYKIDPSPSAPSRLLYATYLGGSSNDTATGIAISSTAAGDPDVYITGQTLSATFLPSTTNGFQPSFMGGSTLGDAFVAKFSSASNSQYTPAYSTYLGGSGDDGATGIAVDASTGRAYITGSTTSPDFPIAAATGLQTAFNKGFSTSGKDAFVTSLNTDGKTLHYSTYLGGELDDQAQGIAFAANDKAYVVGFTASFAFPVSTNAEQKLNQSNNQVGGLGFDAFVSRIAPVSNLSVTLAAHPTNDLQSNTAPQLGDSLTYSVIVANPLGPDPATGITLTFELSTPDIPGTTTPLLNPVSDPNICQYDGNKLFTCTLPDLAVGGQQTLAITGTLTYGQSLTATATANSNEIDAVAASYTLSAGQPLPPPATTVTGGTTPTPTASGGGAIGGPLLLLLMLTGLIHRARIPHCGKPRVDGTHV